MSINSHLTSLAENLVLSENEKSSISTSILTLSTRLNNYFGDQITSHLKFGSFTRGTILPRKADEKSDIDYMIVFNTSNGAYSPQTYLNKLRRFAEDKYSTSEISQSSPTIVLSLNHIRFELVPAIYNNGYEIPSPASSWSEWMATDPNSFNEKLVHKNSLENYRIKPLIRLVKYWNASQGYPFASFFLENYIININFYYCTSLKDYFYDFWRNIGCPYDAPQYTKDKLDRAKICAANAKQYEENNIFYKAEQEIKKIVNDL